MDSWTIVRTSKSGKTSSNQFRVNRTGTFRIYFASPDGDRLIEIRVMKPRRGKGRNRNEFLQAAIYDEATK